jgi:hypothetical protein
MNSKLQKLNKKELLEIIGQLNKKQLINIINTEYILQNGGSNSFKIEKKNSTRTPLEYNISVNKNNNNDVNVLRNNRIYNYII